MGKRKERRLAAMSAAGRRVKLDLFAEPSGEMVDKSSNDGLTGDTDRDHHAGVPTSPSTSGSCCLLGQKQENPLLLLGQYSDDEVKDDANNESNIEVGGTLHTDVAQEGEHVDVGGDAEYRKDQDVDAENVKKDIDEPDATSSVDEKNAGESSILGLKKTDSMAETCASDASVQIGGDVTNGWRIVMHEQTNQYYYWNTLTGETSWEVPDVLSNIVETASDQKASLMTEESISALAHVHASIPQLNTGSVGFVSATAVDNGNVQLMTSVTGTSDGYVVGQENAAGNNMAYDASQVAMNYCISYPEMSAQHSFASLEQTNVHLANSRDDSGLVRSDEETEVHSTRLVKYSESLLERLKMLKGSNENLQRHDWTLKYILEVETRLSDCKALSSYGSSLLPFWWHTETQLKQIESIVDQESSLVHNNKSYNEEVGLTSSLKSDNSVDSAKEHELSMKDNILYNAENALSSVNSMSKEMTNETIHAVETEGAISITKLHSGGLELEDAGETAKSPASIPQPSGGGQEVQEKEEAAVNPVPVLQLSGGDVEKWALDNADKTLFGSTIETHEGEDVDMDVEMEVDEETPTGQPASGNILHLECPEQPEQPIVQCVAPVNMPSDTSHEINVPPPPEEEWVPPPPPEDEAIPPPPPEEPSTQAVPPPPYSENVPSFSYPEQYNLAYPVSAFQYYAPPMSEAPNTTYYAHVEVTHVAEVQPPPYYDAVSTNSFAEVNLVEPVLYYDASVESAPPVPVTSSLEAPEFYVQLGSASYNDKLSTLEHSGSSVISAEYTRSSLPTHKAESDSSFVVQKPDKMTGLSGFIPVTSQSMGSTLVNGSSSDVISTVNVKNQPKVVRSKKRTVGVVSNLRSNKKVSSLVDKWKAAKEELHGDEEDEPENAYEVLEKKRQKEIEEWKSRQIASGEAQDNANFLPLGGDWRERVKRRRVEANAQSTQTPSEQVVNEKKQPDLVELSKDLPSGWQAFWDQSSQEVYYGNAMTSETTWIRPAR